jgi:hypothetical protein
MTPERMWLAIGLIGQALFLSALHHPVDYKRTPAPQRRAGSLLVSKHRR